MDGSFALNWRKQFVLGVEANGGAVEGQMAATCWKHSGLKVATARLACKMRNQT